jgi:hypothetical protein
MSIRLVAWPLWIILLVTYLADAVPVSGHLSDLPFGRRVLQSNDQATFEIVLGIAALIVAILTILLRHYLLIKIKKGTISIGSFKGKIRFVLIHLANWLISGIIVNIGILFAYEAKHTVWTYVFFILYISLMLFHSPRLGPFQQINKLVD